MENDPVPYFCPRCVPVSRTFTTLSALRVHLEDEHVYHSPEPLTNHNSNVKWRSTGRTHRQESIDSVFISPSNSVPLTSKATEPAISRSKAGENRVKGLRNALMKAHGDILLLTEERKSLHHDILQLRRRMRPTPKEVQSKMTLAKPEVASAGVQMTSTTANARVGPDEPDIDFDIVHQNNSKNMKGWLQTGVLDNKSREALEQELRAEIENAKENEKEDWESRSKQMEDEIGSLTDKLEKNQEKIRTLMREMEAKADEGREVSENYQLELDNLTRLLNEKEKLIADYERDSENNKEFMRKLSQKETLARQELDELISGLYTQLEDKDYQLRKSRRHHLLVQTAPPNQQLLGYRPPLEDTGYTGQMAYTSPSSVYYATGPAKLIGDHMTQTTSGILSNYDYPDSGYKMSEIRKGLASGDISQEELLDSEYDTDGGEELPFDEDGIIWG